MWTVTDVLRWVEENVLFMLLAVLLAFGIYQLLGGLLGTATPIVSVVSDSMKPTFERGDLVVVAGTSYETVAVDDVIIFESKHERVASAMPPLIHRVIAKGNGTVSTKGDANNQQVRYCLGSGLRMTNSGCSNGEQLIRIEENIEEEQIIGEMIFVMPYVGYAKLVPTCLVMEASLPSSSSRLDYMCGDMWWR